MTSVEALKAALLGVAVGDALGFPFEGRGREELADLDLSHFHGGLYPPGTWSDDTSLTFITAESLAKRSELDLVHLSQAFLKWLKEGYFTPFGEAIGVGRATREALLRVAEGVPPDQAGGASERDNGNGSLMRILPVALWYAKTPEPERLRIIHLASSLTHRHPRALVACGLMALLVGFLIGGEELKASLEMVAQKAPQVYKNSPFAEELFHYSLLLEGCLFSLPEREVKSSGYVVHTLLATWWVLYQTSTFEEAVIKAVRLGGDTDTLAAVVGGVAGLYYGLSAIPDRWLLGLQRKDLLEKTAEDFAIAWVERWSNPR